MYSKVILVIALINVISCQRENWLIQRIKNGHSSEIVNKRYTNLSSSPASSDNSDAIFTQRTFIPSFRVILLEISLMAISVFLVNGLENYIKKPKINRPKNRKIDQEKLVRDFKNILRNIK